MRLAGVELYFSDLARAKRFYQDVLGLDVAEVEANHHVKFDTTGGFVCVERLGVEDYPSADKAVLFFEVHSLSQVLARIGVERVIKQGGEGATTWAILHDPEGHNIILLEAGAS